MATTHGRMGLKRYAGDCIPEIAGVETMKQNVDCAGDYAGDCAHMYGKNSSTTAECMYCEHVTRIDAHNWKGTKSVATCDGCSALLLDFSIFFARLFARAR